MSGRKEEVTDKLSEPFEYFAFVEKPFDQKQLVEAIREAMMKSKKLPQSVAVSSSNSDAAASGADTSAMAAEIESLKAKIARMEKEMDVLKKQFNQLLSFIRQKIK